MPKFLFKYATVIICCLMAGMVPVHASAKTADLIIVNGAIYTMNERQPKAQMVAVDRILSSQADHTIVGGKVIYQRE